MAIRASQVEVPVVLFCGEDDFAVKQQAKQLYHQWGAELGGMDHEVIEARVGNSSEALRALAKLREALQTLPFFGGGKVVWLKDCNFLGDDRTAGSAEVSATLAELAQELKEFSWDKVRLLISAGKADKRKVFFKTIDKIGRVECHDGWSERDWEDQAELLVRKCVEAVNKFITPEAVGELVARVGPQPRQFASEVEKLALYSGDRPQITLTDVLSVSIQNKTARAFALADALGNRNLPLALRYLDEELWTMQFDRDKSEIGLLYGLISKVRSLLLLQEMLREGWIRSGGDYTSFQSQLKTVAQQHSEHLPKDKRYNPLGQTHTCSSKLYHKWILTRAMN